MNKVIENIQSRKSTRTYLIDADITEQLTKLEQVISQINNTSGLFGNCINVSIITKNQDSSQMKLGTYGVIKGATHYLTVSVKPGADYLFDVGFLFETIILEATNLGLDTVWMAGTFSRKHFKAALGDPSLELPIVSPIGKRSQSQSFVTKYIVKSKNHVRSDFSSMFFEADGKTPLVLDNSDPYMLALEMVRIAPSALNKQPWRIVKDCDKFHFFAVTPAARHAVDLGIALNHFVTTLESFSINGTVIKSINNTLPNYCFTWKLANTDINN